jgi:hypothetical protein
VREHFPQLVFDTVIPRNVRLGEAPSFGRPVIHHDPHCAGSEAYFELAKEVAAVAERRADGPRPRRDPARADAPEGASAAELRRAAGRADRAQPAPAAPRFDEEALQRSPSSLRERGVLQPVLVRPRRAAPTSSSPGERRWRAAQLAGPRDAARARPRRTTTASRSSSR